MIRAPLIAAKIRDRRRALDITQSSLAATLGISPSYLNLIEGGKRNIGGNLLNRIAGALDLAVDELDGAAERRLLNDLGEFAAEPLFAELRLDPSTAAEFAGRHAGWARAVVALHREWVDRGQAVGALSDRLNHDPFLGDAVHKLLTRVSAIRSSSEILETVADLAPAERQRFVAIVGSESHGLADLAQTLAAYFDKSHSGTRSTTPAGEVDDFIFDHGNHFPTLELTAEALRAAASMGKERAESRLVDYLEKAHAVRVHMRDGSASGAAAPLTEFDPASRTFAVAAAAPPASLRFELARLAADLSHRDGPLEREIVASPLLTSEAARRRARRAASSYLAAAILLPYPDFHAATLRARYDVEVLAGQFGASVEQVCHRLVTLRRPGAEGIPFGMMRIDAAGFATKRFPLPRLPLPRHGNACPLWAVYQALQTPGTVVRQLAQFPGGERFLLVARAVEKRGPVFPMPRRVVSIMLACDALYADQTVYGDGLDLSSAAPAVPVGANCRVCTRQDCAYREEDSIVDA
jgi:hypothetical protein